jgi:hypothetical protein
MIVMWATVLVGLARTNVEGKTLGRVTVMTVGAGKHEPTKTTGKPNVASANNNSNTEHRVNLDIWAHF